MSTPLGFRRGEGPAMPTLPTGYAVAAYPTYAGAAGAVEFLAKSEFDVADVTIVGSDLQLVERVTGRLTLGKIAAAGAASGAWLGVFVGLVMSMFSEARSLLALIAFTIGIGAAFGAVMGALGYAMTKNRRDFTSASQVVARRYDVLCEPRTAERARDLLAKMQMGHAPQ